MARRARADCESLASPDSFNPQAPLLSRCTFIGAPPLVAASGGSPFCAQTIARPVPGVAAGCFDGSMSVANPIARGSRRTCGWSGMMRTIGAISDTHGLLRPQALAALAGCDPIIHAGDVGSPDVLARLGALAPVHAVRGNVDHGAWSANLPVTQRIEIDGFRIYVLHILAELDPQAAVNVDAVIYGHSHQPKIETKNGTLFFNPGSAGPRRFRLPITVGRMTTEHGKLRAEIVELSVER
jgi:uncharacterized protein